MKQRTVLLILAVALLCLGAEALHAQNPPAEVIESVSVIRPVPAPEGCGAPDSETTQDCLACHTAPPGFKARELSGARTVSAMAAVTTQGFYNLRLETVPVDATAYRVKGSVSRGTCSILDPADGLHKSYVIDFVIYYSPDGTWNWDDPNNRPQIAFEKLVWWGEPDATFTTAGTFNYADTQNEFKLRVLYCSTCEVNCGHGMMEMISDALVPSGGFSPTVTVLENLSASAKIGYTLPASANDFDWATITFVNSSSGDLVSMNDISKPIPPMAVFKWDGTYAFRDENDLRNGDLVPPDIYKVFVSIDAATAAQGDREVTLMPVVTCDGKPASAYTGNCPPCAEDVNCHYPAWNREKRGVALITWEGVPGNCTGALLKDRPGGNTNWLLTAKHCASPSDTAKMKVYFDFTTNKCNGTAPGLAGRSYVKVARYILGDENSDFALLELEKTLPAGAFPLDWDETNYADGSQVKAAFVHHPGETYQRIALGTATRTNTPSWGLEWNCSNVSVVPGSSGAPLFVDASTKKIIGHYSGGGRAFHPFSEPWKKGLSHYLRPPNVALILNQSSFTGMDPLIVQARVTNDDTPDTVKVQLWMTLPNGTRVLLSEIPTQGIPVGAATTINLPLRIPFFGGNEPAGTYELAGRLLDTATDILLSEDIKTFTYVQ